MIYRSAKEAAKAFAPIFQEMGWLWGRFGDNYIPTIEMIEYKFNYLLERGRQTRSDKSETGRLVVENVSSGKPTFRLNDRSWQEYKGGK